MQHHLSVQGWCMSARATWLVVENPPVCHQLGGFHGMSDAAVYLCPFHREQLIVGVCYPSMLTINLHILIQVIAELLREDELSSMGTVIKYSYHNAVSRIHPIIPDQSATSSKNQEGWFDLVRNERKKHSCCFVFFGEWKQIHISFWVHTKCFSDLKKKKNQVI